MCLLDSPSQLTNVINRYGLKITEGNSTSVYAAQRKLKKHLNEQLKTAIQRDYDRSVLIDKIVDRCEDVSLINGIYEMLDANGSEYFAYLASGKLRPFFNTVNQYVA